MTSSPKRLAIVGGGSSGLITLKHALDRLPDWEIVCFEKSNRIEGVWGNPYPGFLSTSTKYTTQFSCYPEFDAHCQPDEGASKAEFFRDGEYGAYLRRFAEKFSLHSHVRFSTTVDEITRTEDGDRWRLKIHSRANSQDHTHTEVFDAVVICIGLHAVTQPVNSSVHSLSVDDLRAPERIAGLRGKRIVVMGGGESGVDYAWRLSDPAWKNEVYLSLRSGIRVTPRYHPIRGVPSDFLRNRLLLSHHPGLRNLIGQKFVSWRIRYQELFERLFPGSVSARTDAKPENTQLEHTQRRKEWAFKLMRHAKDDLFNMFHNKSDLFLDRVADGHLQIIGPPADTDGRTFYAFASGKTVEVNAEYLVPAMGFRSQLCELTDGQIELSQFYLGCVHAECSNLFLVGFARPIIGNIPSISEMQARYICGIIAGDFKRPKEIQDLHQADAARRQQQYSRIDRNVIYPVEMIPYCDELACLMDKYPTIRKTRSLRHWWRIQTAPATTMHYFQNAEEEPIASRTAPTYLPGVLIAFLVFMKPINWIYCLVTRAHKKRW
ncbi:MAG: hypothetical protein CMJ46_15455 [Planctomyces sp.]|nr:hypothetical protein [Planctomyces sp.]